MLECGYCAAENAIIAMGGDTSNLPDRATQQNLRSDQVEELVKLAQQDHNVFVFDTKLFFDPTADVVDPLPAALARFHANHDVALIINTATREEALDSHASAHYIALVIRHASGGGARVEIYDSMGEGAKYTPIALQTLAVFGNGNSLVFHCAPWCLR